MEYIVENKHGRFTIVQDKQYGFWRVNPPPTDDFLRSYYEEQYQNPTYSFHDALFSDLIKRWAPEVAQNPGRVLEIGCGNGDKLLAFHSEGYDVFGFEPGAADYQICESKGLQVFNQPFDVAIAHSQGPYSVLLLSNILEHVPYPEHLLEEIYPLLEPKGVLLINVPNEFNALQEVFLKNTGERRWFLSPPSHLNYFTPDSLSNLLNNYGWKIHHRTTRFPMELFLLMGRNYINDPDLGGPAHLERVEFEKSFLGGNEETLWKFYDSLAQAELGREIIVICQKSEATLT